MEISETPTKAPRCPMCLEAVMETKFQPWAEETIQGTTEVLTCPKCPCVAFEFHLGRDYRALGEALELKKRALLSMPTH